MAISHSDRCPTCHRKMRRSRQANALYWALLSEMEDKLEPDGKKYGKEQYHLYYRARFLGCDDYNLPNGNIVTIPRSTADLDVAEFADFFDKVQADAALRGVYLADLETV